METIKKIKIKRINVVQNEDVYDLSIKDNHNFFANRILVHNCGEIVLCPYDSCRLMSINLYSYVSHPFTESASFDFAKYTQHVMIAQRMMDDIVDLEIEKIDKIINKIKSDPEPDYIKHREIETWERIKEKGTNGRRTGLGVTGEGDMLAALNLTYGTPEATEFAINIHKILARTAYYSSTVLASERGAFPIFDTNKEILNGQFDNPFLKRVYELFTPYELELYKHCGRRNIALLTIAPVGSGSILTQTSSGIEPVYLVSYKRRRKINSNDKDTKAAFVDDLGVVWEEYNIMHPKFIKWLKVNNYNVDEIKILSNEKMSLIIEQSPYHNATSQDIDWVEKVKMQGGVQQWVDHSISNTINIPTDTSVDIVATLYKTAWEQGCKGVTVYRDGSRDGVLLKETQKEEQELSETIKYNHAPKRPKTIDCEVIRFKNKNEWWRGFIGLINDKPYEIFTGKEEGIAIPSSVKRGKITKIKNTGEDSSYNFSYIDKDGNKITYEKLNRSFVNEYWNYAKFTSGLLRHGMPLVNLIDLLETLKLYDDDFGTWKSGVMRMLKQYIKDGTHSKKLCPECKTESLFFEGGCMICKNCGYSACS
jgi:ribonucleoside-diphosphate reductase alpha chain